MSDFLIIAGVPIPVQDGSFKEQEPQRGGSEFRSYNGKKRSTVRWEKRDWAFTTGEMLKSEGDAFRTSIALNKEVSVTGTALAITARLRITGSTVINAITDDTNNWEYTYDVSMSEI